MRRQLVPGPVVRLTVIKAKTRPGIEARFQAEFSLLYSPNRYKSENSAWDRGRGGPSLGARPNSSGAKSREFCGIWIQPMKWEYCYIYSFFNLQYHSLLPPDLFLSSPSPLLRKGLAPRLEEVRQARCSSSNSLWLLSAKTYDVGGAWADNYCCAELCSVCLCVVPPLRTTCLL